MAILLPILAACAAPTAPGRSGAGVTAINPRDMARVAPDHAEVGIASWYGREYHGKRTASGERFDMNALTAAHKTLPLSSRVRVTNLENGRSVVLRVNDRGPFVRGRIVDVSRRGAEVLGFLDKGLVRVRLEALPSS